MKGIEAVRIGLQYSRAGVSLLAVWTAGTVAVACVTPWSMEMRAGWLCGVLSLALEALMRVGFLRGPRAVRSMRMQRDGTIEVERPSGARVTGRVRAGSFVAPWLVIVRWRAQGSRWDSTVLLLPDMAEAKELRRLRILLRWA